MTALHFDTLLYTNQLIEAGVPPEVAQVHAQTLRQAFGFYVDDLVTKDYLDHRFTQQFAQQEARLEQRFSELELRMEQRFSDMDLRFENRFAEMEVRIEQRFSAQETKLEQRFSAQDAKLEQRFSGIDSRLSRLEVSVRLLTTVMVAGVILPNLVLAARMFLSN